MNSPTSSQASPLPTEARRFRWSRIIAFLCGGIVLLFLAAIIIPCFVDSPSAANEAGAVGSLRTITGAERQFSEQHPEKGFASSLSELGPSEGGQLDAALASGTKSGYIFTISLAARDSAGRITKYAVTASPQTFNKTGMRSFFTDESGVIRYTPQNRPAAVSDTALQ